MTQENVTHASGLVRGSTEGKVDYRLALDGPMFERYAVHMSNAASNKGKRNWLKACTAKDLDRFDEGATRHFYQWQRGDVDEDHAAAIFFNVNGVEYVKEHLGADDQRLAPKIAEIQPFRKLSACGRQNLHLMHDWKIDYGDGTEQLCTCPGWG